MASRSPKCRICSYQQPKGRESIPIYHRHASTRHARVLQGAEYANKNCTYMCPSCQVPHMAAMEYGLDICLSDSTLHEIHHPREPGVICPPDSSHVDWLTIPGATVEELLFAWQVEYGHEPRPMRILLVAGLNDLVKGGTSSPSPHNTKGLDIMFLTRTIVIQVRAALLRLPPSCSHQS